MPSTNGRNLTGKDWVGILCSMVGVLVVLFGIGRGEVKSIGEKIRESESRTKERVALFLEQNSIDHGLIRSELTSLKTRQSDIAAKMATKADVPPKWFEDKVDGNSNTIEEIQERFEKHTAISEQRQLDLQGLIKDLEVKIDKLTNQMP